MKSLKVVIVYASRYGHTKLQAEAVARGAAAVPDSEVVMMTADEAAKRLDELDSADAIIMGTATYMGNMSSELIRFMEESVSRWGKQMWSGKVAGGFTNSSNFSGDKLNTLLGIVVCAMQQGMIWVGVGQLVGANEPDGGRSNEGFGPNAVNRNSASIGPMASSFQVKAPEAPPAGDIATAEAYGRRVAEVALKLKK